MMASVAAVSIKLNGLGSCECDHWRDARTMWIIGWAAIAVVFALAVYLRRVRARRRALAGPEGGSIDIAAKRRREVDGMISWERGVVRIASGSMHWQRDIESVVLEAASVRHGPAVGASQFPFTVSVIARIGDSEEATFAVRPGDDVVMVESDRKMAAAARASSSWVR